MADCTCSRSATLQPHDAGCPVPLDICPLSDLPADQCGCRHHAPEADKASQALPARAVRPGRPFEARYPGRCAECDERIHEGDRICTTPDGPIHADCVAA